MIFERISLLRLLGYLEDGEWKCESNDHYYLRLNFIDIKYQLLLSFVLIFEKIKDANVNNNYDLRG